MNLAGDPGAFFSPVEQRLLAFAGHFNLKVSRYAYGQPIWEFFCKHPLGGVIIVSIQRNTHQPRRSLVFVNSIWARDDFKRRERWYWRSEIDVAELEADAVDALLEEALREASTMTLDRLTLQKAHPAHWTEERIKSLREDQDAMPEPRLQFSSGETGAKAN